MLTYALILLSVNAATGHWKIFNNLQVYEPKSNDLYEVNKFSNDIVTAGPEPPIFSPYYVTSGILRIPYAEIEEPFNAWIDFEKKRSRIDYYGGIMKTYQLGDKYEFGTMLKVAPMTTEVVNNILSCFQVNGTEDSPVDIQRMIPDLTEFQYIADTVMNGYITKQFQLNKKFGYKNNQYNMWVAYEPNGRKSIPVPVRYEMKGFNSLLGSHYDHYIVDYGSYSAEIPSDDVFTTDDSMTCRSFPGPGLRDLEHRILMNPMHEYIHGEESHIDSLFSKFKSFHSKQYKELKEEHHRATLFKHNLRFIDSTNRKGLSYKLKLNHLADRSPEEISLLRGRKPHLGSNGAELFKPKNNSVPDYWDWRLRGAVTPVKDQATCGSCYTFSTVAAIEGAYFVKTGQLIRLSQQAIIDCTWGWGNNGCDGGEDFRGYQWALKHGGIPTAESYGQYMGIDGFCHSENSTLIPITGYTNVTSNDQNSLKLALVQHSPISVAIDASPRTFSFYSHGVYYEEKCKNGEDDLDHAVTLVGYGTLDGEDYWLIKNSWSTYWGNDGYILMSQKDNNCGVATSPTFVTM